MSSNESENDVEVLLEVDEAKSESTEDPPMSEWPSLVMAIPETNRKRLLCSQGLYSSGSGEICTKYIAMSDSKLFRHPYYKYPVVNDPGIKEALLEEETKVVYSDDGQDLYMALCDEMNVCPVREFHRGLILDKIILRYYGVNPVGVRAMAMALRSNKFVRVFDLTDNWLTQDACYHLGKMLSENMFLKELSLANCRIEPKGIQNIQGSLKVNCTLEALDLSGNLIGDEGAECLATRISEGIKVSRLNLSNNELCTKTALVLAESLDCSSKLTHLDLSRNQFYNISATVKLLNGIAQSDVLEELNLGWNSLTGDRIAEALCGVMKRPKFKCLDLNHNKFCGEAIDIIASSLIKAKTLKTLNLSYNPLTPTDAYVLIGKLLKPRVKIQNLFLEDVWITKEFIWCLQQLLCMKSRKNAVITYGGIIHAYTIKGPDARELILQRADYLGKANKKNRVDVALFFLQLNKEYKNLIDLKTLQDRVKNDNIPLNDGLINELSNIFPGPKTSKSKTVDLVQLAEYMSRMWPKRKLPPTPPEPELVVEEVVVEPPKPSKGKKGKDKK